MKRRSFLAMLGLAPVAASVPALAAAVPDVDVELEKDIADFHAFLQKGTRDLVAECEEAIVAATGPHSALASSITFLR